MTAIFLCVPISTFMGIIIATHLHAIEANDLPQTYLRISVVHRRIQEKTGQFVYKNMLRDLA